MNENKKQPSGSRASGIVVGTVSTVVLVAFGVQAQEQGGAFARFDLSFGSQYQANDPDEDEHSLATGLGLFLSSVTDVQSFALSASGRYVYDQDGFEFENPRFALDYARQNRSTAFDVGLDYSSRDVDGAFDMIDPVTGTITDLVDDDGTLETINLNAGLETGRDAPFGTETTFSYTDRTYADTTDPDLADLTSWQIGTALRFDVDPRIGLRVNASYRETQEDDAFETVDRTSRVGVGGTFRIDPLWSASLNLQYSRFETEQTVFGFPILTEEDGTGFSLSVGREFRDGTLGVSLARDVSDIGAEDSLRIFRDRELANGGELAWSLGIVSFPNGETAPVVSASYAMPMPRGGLSVGLSQTAAVNGDDESVVRTAIDFGFDQEINARSGWSLNGSLTSIDVIGGDAEDRSRAELGVAYNYALTRDWDLSTALRHRVRYEDGKEDERASILSLSLERSFTFRP